MKGLRGQDAHVLNKYTVMHSEVFSFLMEMKGALKRTVQFRQMTNSMHNIIICNNVHVGVVKYGKVSAENTSVSPSSVMKAS